jgi:two-component system sensor histidine kinase GlrK
LENRARQPSGLSLRVIVGGGFTVVAVSLGLALSFAISTLEQLGDQSERLLESGVNTTRLIEQLAERITDVERTARQYTVVGSPNLQQIYRDRRQTLIDTMSALEVREDVPALAPALQQLHALLGQIEESMNLAPDSRENLEAFAAMNDIARRAREIAQGRFDRELARLQAGVTQVRTALTALSVAVVTATLLTALGFARLISRPMRQITASINALGRAELDTPVQVSGPRDLQSIGVSLDWLRQRIQDLESQKSTFVRHMSHELKSPLANIRAGIELLSEEAGSDPDKQEIAAIVERNAARLQRQIDDLLRYAGWQDAQPPQQPVNVKLHELMEKSIQDQEFEARSRGIEVRADLNTISMMAEESQVRAIVDNLISNAIKYSPNGGVIDVRLSRLGDAALMEVVDQGPGIPADLREQVFEPFFRGPDAGATAGTGIGLSLAMTAARAHGGSIRILDKQGGAHLEVSLPVGT